MSDREKWVIIYNLILAAIAVIGVIVSKTGWPMLALCLFFIVKRADPTDA